MREMVTLDLIPRRMKCKLGRVNARCRRRVRRVNIVCDTREGEEWLSAELGSLICVGVDDALVATGDSRRRMRRRGWDSRTWLGWEGPRRKGC